MQAARQNEYAEMAAYIEKNRQRLRRKLAVKRYTGWAMKTAVAVGIVALVVL